MAKDETKDSIAANGLRYHAKASGSPFGPAISATKSCFLCGKHRPLASLQFRRVLGKHQAVCSPSCKEVDELLATAKSRTATK